jgi:UDP:flavonoid glycosyltransferase YjiC (YdhE family)
MRVVLTAVGTSGDVFPFLGLGAGLAARGHDVLVVSHSHFAVPALHVGVGFAPVGTEVEYLGAVAGNPKIWDPDDGFAEVVRCATALVPELYEVVRDNVAIPDTIVVAHYLDFGSRLVQSAFGAPVLTALTAPMGFAFAERYLAEAALPEPLCALRDELGPGWNFSPLMTIGLFPDWFMAAEPVWPGPLKFTGFPLFDAVEPVPAEIDEMFDEGEPPIVFILGPRIELAAGVSPQPFVDAVAEACELLGRRGLILGAPKDKQLDIPSGLAQAAFAPLTRVLPRAAAIVHHGGIGTIAAAMASGIPQLAMPVCHDQPDNAMRMAQLGVGDWLPLGSLDGSVLAEKLAELLESSEVQQQCADLRERCRQADPIASACAVIEFMARRTSWGRPAELLDARGGLAEGAGNWGCSCGGACGPGWA